MKFMNGWNEIQKSVQLYLLLNGSQKSNPKKERRLFVNKISSTFSLEISSNGESIISLKSNLLKKR